MLLLSGAASATPPLVPAVARNAEVAEAHDVGDLPLATFDPPPRVRLGATPPTLQRPSSHWYRMDAAVGVEANLRVTTSTPWLQPEGRLAVEHGLDVDQLALFDRASDYQVVVTLGPRVGGDQGLYAGAGGGVVFLASMTSGGRALSLVPAYAAYAGYLGRVGEHLRIGPEATIGTRNTVALRMEWGR